MSSSSLLGKVGRRCTDCTLITHSVHIFININRTESNGALLYSWVGAGAVGAASKFLPPAGAA
jgi:hypothetical protein